MHARHFSVFDILLNVSARAEIQLMQAHQIPHIVGKSLSPGGGGGPDRD